MARAPRRDKTRTGPRDSALTAMGIAAVCGLGVFQASEIIFDNLRDGGANGAAAGAAPAWRVHMASSFAAFLAVAVVLFLLRRFERRSSRLALSSVTPAFPCIFVTGIATIVHIPAVLVLAIVSACLVWAAARVRDSATRS